MKNNLKKIRESKGLSQEKLAYLSGVSRNTIYLLENNRLQNTTAKTLNAICKALDTPLDKVFLFE